MSTETIKTKCTKRFSEALKYAQDKTVLDFEKWCVCLKYGTYLACPLAYALDHNYPVVTITL